MALLTQQFHLHDPVYIQYYYYLAGLVQGNWDLPVTNQPVLYSIESDRPATVELKESESSVTIVFGIPLGIFAATHKGRLGIMFRGL